MTKLLPYPEVRRRWARLHRLSAAELADLDGVYSSDPGSPSVWADLAARLRALVADRVVPGPRGLLPMNTLLAACRHILEDAA